MPRVSRPDNHVVYAIDTTTVTLIAPIPVGTEPRAVAAIWTVLTRSHRRLSAMAALVRRVISDRVTGSASSQHRAASIVGADTAQVRLGTRTVAAVRTQFWRRD